NPDIIHIHDLISAKGALKLAERLRLPVIYDSHELWLDRNLVVVDRELKLSLWIQKRLEKKIFKIAVSKITVSESIAKLLAERYGSGRVEVVRNIVDLKFQTSTPLKVTYFPEHFNLVYSGHIMANR